MTPAEVQAAVAAIDPAVRVALAVWAGLCTLAGAMLVSGIAVLVESFDEQSPAQAVLGGAMIGTSVTVAYLLISRIAGGGS